MAVNIKEWQRIYDSIDAHLEELPGKWDKALSDLAKLGVLRALRMDKVTEAVVNFVSTQVAESARAHSYYPIKQAQKQC